MKRFFLPVLSAMLLARLPLAAAENVTNLKAFWREGQTFITWQELGGAEKVEYAVYTSQNPITKDTLAGAVKLATIAPGSAFNQMVLAKARKLDPKAEITEVTPAVARYAIEDNPGNDPRKFLSATTGLFVGTTHANGKYYYAVAPVAGGVEQPGRMAALPAAIEEQAMLPGAVIQWMDPGRKGAVYCHWMDYSQWDPDPKIEGYYAYNFGVAVPEKYNKEDAPLPVKYYGHGMSETYRGGKSAPYAPALWIWLGDPSGSWWLGVKNRKGDKVVNYVEQRIRWSFEWLKAGRPNQFFKVDPRHVYGHGHSMGGTMMTMLALRMGDIFSHTVSSCGATIHSRNKNWLSQASRLWGTPEQNLPLPDGTPVWDYQNYAKWSLDHIARDSAYFVMNNGTKDGSVVFEPVPDFIEAMQKAKRPFAAFWGPFGHSWSPAQTKNARWEVCQLANDETLPAFANASNNDDPRAAGKGQVNGKLEWSASGNDFDKASKDDDPLDSQQAWAVTIRSLSGPATVDVTPRKVKVFKFTAGHAYTWENLDLSDPKNPKSLVKGTVKADQYGLVTVEKFQMDKNGWGNRLVIKAAN